MHVSFSLILLKCGGLGDKSSGILASVDWLEPDILCLQELWDSCDLDALELSNFTVF